MLVMDAPPREDDSLSSAMNNNHHAKEVYQSWHPHVYANPPKTPTPHMISDILGWSGTPTDPPVDRDEPLNLTVRSRSPQRPFREPATNGVDKAVNGRLEFHPKAVRRAASGVNKEKNDGLHARPLRLPEPQPNVTVHFRRHFIPSLRSNDILMVRISPTESTKAYRCPHLRLIGH
ncbi:hypothetical protein J6590_013441 [Homalodisca vitripennis]|nr:hypothetical protein J6590_013441 [Homalodisca vitripennis]